MDSLARFRTLSYFHLLILVSDIHYLQKYSEKPKIRQFIIRLKLFIKINFKVRNIYIKCNCFYESNDVFFVSFS